MNSQVRQLLLPVLLLGLSYSGTSQVEYLRLSPAQTIVQRVGATDVTLNFSRPQAKGRHVFGGLVPYDQLWRTGANENTTISFSHRVRIGETEVAAGTYALFTKPSPQNWEIYLYTETNHLDVPNPLDSTKLIYLTEVAVRTAVAAEETLAINLYDLTEHAATLGIQWEHTTVRVPISFYTQEAMELVFEKEMRQNVFDLNIAAGYYQQRDLELSKARKYQELAMELRGEPNPWDLHNYAIILYKLGDVTAAKRSVQQSMELAVATNNAYLITENQRLIDEWVTTDNNR